MLTDLLAAELPTLAESISMPRLPSPAELDRIMRTLFKDNSEELPESNYV